MPTRVQRKSADVTTNLQDNTAANYTLTIGGTTTLALDTTAFTTVGRTRYMIFKYITANLSGSWSNVTTSVTGTRYSRVEGYGTSAIDGLTSYYYVIVS